jgi:selenocysteine-specific elongation factor
VDVVATAGHVDHGKSTLVRALTGMEPDRWEEERRRGLTLDLGFAWMTLPGGREIAFVDVPGHERFVPTMLAGVGPVPATMFVVAADEGWRPQSAEHLAALDAIGVRHGVLVITRSDLADPAPATAEALEQLAGTTLAGLPAVAVSGRTGAGLDELRTELARLADRMPAPDTDDDVRLWIDRVFTVHGAGTVVTGTLGAGTLRTDDELEVSTTGRRVRVRALQTLKRARARVPAPARVAVNLRGVERTDLARGVALLTPRVWPRTTVVDVALRHAGEAKPPTRLVLHVGSAAVPTRLRPLGTTSDGMVARLTLAHPLPLRTGDRGVLRDPGRPRGEDRVIAGAVVLDVHPPQLRRRGAARARAADLAEIGRLAVRSSTLDRERLASLHLRHRGFLRTTEFHAMGLPPAGTNVAGDWWVDPARWADLIAHIPTVVAEWLDRDPVAAGVQVEVVRRRLGLPPDLVELAVREAGLHLRDGRVRRADAAALPPEVDQAVTTLEKELADAPFAAPDAHRLAALGLRTRELAAAVRAGRLRRIADGVVLLPDAVEQARHILAELPQPFTVSQAKTALRTTRRVAVPLMELLDREGVTERLPDGSHRLRAPATRDPTP